MRLDDPHVLGRLGAEHISWILTQPRDQLDGRIQKAKASGDHDLVWCYEQVQQLKDRYDRLMAQAG